MQARLRLEAAQLGSWVAAGHGDVMAFRPGTVFTLASGPDARPSLDGKYLLTAVTHHGDCDGLGLGSYVNEIACIPFDVPFRPARLPRPKADGIDFALVTVPGEEQVWTDRHGRVRVRFMWHRDDSDPSDRDSSWIPVVLNWAGPGYGMQILPRRGMVVAIAYYGGDADLPMVIGTIATTENSHPHELPLLKSRLSIVSQSMRDGGNDAEHYNELTMEDAAGAEQLILRAGWDYLRTVLNDATVDIHHDETYTVGGRQAVTVKGDRTDAVGKNETRIVSGDRKDTVQGHEERVVDKDQTLTVTGTRTTEVVRDEKVTFRADRQTVIEGSELAHVQRDRKETVDGAYQVKQSGTFLELASGHVDLTSEAGIRLRHAGSTILIDGGKIQIASDQPIEVASSQTISVTGDKVEISGGTEVSLSAGGARVVLNAEGVKQSGASITSAAQGLHTITGALVSVN